MKIDVIIRVFDRIEDLKYNLNIIKDTWKRNDYNIIVVSNGSSYGYLIPEEVIKNTNKTIILENNAGHLKGNSQLLLTGIEAISNSESDFTIILESDTWIYSDDIIIKYCNLLNQKNAVWASARWYDKYYSLATDFAIIKSSFLISNPELLDFSYYPECKVCNYLIDHKQSYLWIKENMNVMVPSYIKRFPYAPKGRFYVFPLSKMVTHHIEDIKGGMSRKKYEFNVVCGFAYFTDIKLNRYFKLEKFLMKTIHFIDKLFLRRSWYRKRTNLNVSN